MQKFNPFTVIGKSVYFCPNCFHLYKYYTSYCMCFKAIGKRWTFNLVCTVEAKLYLTKNLYIFHYESVTQYCDESLLL